MDGQSTAPSTTNPKHPGLRPPWKPGVSPNPGGRAALPEAFKAKGPDALMRLVQLMDHNSPSIALRAAEVVVERVYGRATQPMEHEGGMAEALLELIRARRNGHSP